METTNNQVNGNGNGGNGNQGNGGGTKPPSQPPSRPGSPSPSNDDNESHHSNHDHDCPPEPCFPHEFDMTLEIKPIVNLCIAKPYVKIKRNNAICICTPCKS